MWCWIVKGEKNELVGSLLNYMQGRESIVLQKFMLSSLPAVSSYALLLPVLGICDSNCVVERAWFKE